MKLKKGMRALSLLMVMALLGAIFVPAVSAVEETEKENLSTPLVCFEGFTKKADAGQIKQDLQLQQFQQKAGRYSLVSFDILGFRDELSKKSELPVIIDGKKYTMILEEYIVEEKGGNSKTLPYSGHLKNVDNSKIVMTISDCGLIASIILNGEEYCIESLSDKDLLGNRYEIEYRVSDLRVEGEYLYGIEDYLAHSIMSDEELKIRSEEAKIEEEQKASKSKTYVRVLVMTDAKWIYDEPDWQNTAEEIIFQANQQLGRSDINVHLIATYDTSKASELAADAQNLIQDPLGTFINHVPVSYLNSKSADIAIYLGGYDCTDPGSGVGATWGYDADTLKDRRYAWVQMADDPSPYDAIIHDRTVTTLHEIGHLFDADHQDGMQGPNQENYNRAYQWNWGSTTQSVVWAPILRSTSYEYSSNDYNGNYYHNNALRIYNTRNVVASYA
ncbi:zinc-dependent metalloprotease [Methanomicrobium antiquum]|uniref:Zinc-dependent metalloprotease n=1 Tax=Methanomicrobium antiquum TaxID=487686 RepID=A0AAF0FMI9_9EURY|nr:zinc-dependent metalloprotease family protein [Methanomicrobium antiquum]WFN36585.1 zinc-dependent metalloprotease [Methanomicrobium antiquum]